MTSRQSIVIYGAGAVGCFVGGKILLGKRQDEGYGLTLVGRPRIMEAIGTHGLVLREGDSQSRVHPTIPSSIEDIGTCDLAVLAVRTFDVAASIPDIRRILGASGFVLALQNGVGTEEVLANELGRERVIVGTVTVSVGMEQPGIVTRYSHQGGLALSSMTSRPVPDWIIARCIASGLPVTVVPDYRSLRWSKLLLNMLGAPISAILDADLRSIVRNRRLFRLEQLAIREAGRVMDAQHIKTVSLPGYPVGLVRLAMRLPRPLAQPALAPRLAQARGGHSPTMRSDMYRNRSEIGALNGAIVRAGYRTGTRTTVNEALTTLVEELVQHPDRRAEFQSRPDRLILYLRQRGICV